MDDIIIVSDNLEDFNIMCKIITDVLKYMDMCINKSKTYFLTNDDQPDLKFQVGGHNIQPVIRVRVRVSPRAKILWRLVL